uniref:Uncharacterized protein n=1 Tax=Arundo donax TaxID=35708 RepID=A0A0A9HQD0_ARUDO
MQGGKNNLPSNSWQILFLSSAQEYKTLE